MTPAYDLLNTRRHLPNESTMAPDLFDLDFETESFKITGFYARDDFTVFGVKLGMQAKANGAFPAENSTMGTRPSIRF